ncbi:uncharacterized protein LOC144510814 [Mustelus asterias]
MNFWSAAPSSDDVAGGRNVGWSTTTSFFLYSNGAMGSQAATLSSRWHLVLIAHQKRLSIVQWHGAEQNQTTRHPQPGKASRRTPCSTNSTMPLKGYSRWN